MNLNVILSKRYKYLFLIVSCASVIIVAGWFAAQESAKHNARDLDQSLNEHLGLYTKFLTRELNHIELLGNILAQNPQIVDALRPGADHNAIAQANKTLESTNQKSKTMAIYLMNRTGLTVAASNYGEEDSFIGKNYSFRPYFTDAIETGRGRFLAIGMTSNALGYYIAHSVKSEDNVHGVLVIKVDLSPIDDFVSGIDGDYFLSDNRGIIFMSSNKTFELKSLSTITADDRLYITRTRQYPINKIEKLENRPSKTHFGSYQAYSINYSDYLIKSTTLEDLGWKVWLMAPVAPIKNQALSSAMAVSLTGLIALIAFYLLYILRKNTERFQIIVDNLPSGVTFFNNNLQMVMCNEMVKNVLGFPAALFKNGLPSLKQLIDYNVERGEYGEGNPNEIARDLMDRAEQRKNHVFERRRPDGTVLEIRGVWVKQGLITTYTDITERKKAEDEARRTSGYLRALLQNLDQGVTVTDENLDIIFWNNAFFDLLELPDHLKKPIMKYEDLIRYNAERGEYGPGDPEKHVQMRVQASLKFEPHKFERVRPDGHTLQVTGKPLHVDGAPFGFISTYVDITEHKRMAANLRKLANTDALTDLNNRRHFTTLLEREIKRCKRNGNPLSLLLLDLDHFKNINDRYGHNTGDTALKAFSKTCKEVLRDIDIIGRTGGEEFCIFLPDTDREGAYISAERLRKAVERTEVHSDDGDKIVVTVSIGVATLDNVMGDRIEDLLQRADKALYRAKHEGRNRVC